MDGQAEDNLVKTRIYLAGPFPTRAMCERLRDMLQAEFGPRLEIHAQWLHDHDGQTTEWHLLPEQAEGTRAMATRDLRGVAASHGVVLYNPTEFAQAGTGGRHVETGAALMTGKPVFILGVASNIFHRAQGVAVFADYASLVAALRAWMDTRQAAAPQG